MPVRSNEVGVGCSERRSNRRELTAFANRYATKSPRSLVLALSQVARREQTLDFQGLAGGHSERQVPIPLASASTSRVRGLRRTETII